MQWNSCPPAPLAWLSLRELLLGLNHIPVLVLPIVAILAFTWYWKLSRTRTVALALLLPLALSAIYSPPATALLSGWLHSQLPAAPASGSPAVVVLLGRGEDIAAATTATAAAQLRHDPSLSVYVSGDARSTADRFVQLGVAPTRIAGDSCASTTWENATLTAAWLRQHHPGATVLLITDPWQLPRASRAFARQGLQVHPLAAEPQLSAPERNRLALRESAGTVLYLIQGRM